VGIIRIGNKLIMTEKTKGVISNVVAAIAFGFIMMVVMDGDSSFLNLFIGFGLAGLVRYGVRSLL
jgi:hypothetical protein